MQPSRLARRLNPVLAPLLLLFSAAAGRVDEQGATITAIEVDPPEAGADTLCRLMVEITNDGRDHAGVRPTVSILG